MNDKKLLICLLSLVLVFGAACFEKQKIEISEITARVGQQLVLKFKSNPTTGYSWQLQDNGDESIVKFVSSSYQTSAADGRVGAGGTETWTFQALKTGQTKLGFVYVRPWEKNQPPAEKKSFQIIVK